MSNYTIILFFKLNSVAHECACNFKNNTLQEKACFGTCFKLTVDCVSSFKEVQILNCAWFTKTSMNVIKCGSIIRPYFELTARIMWF